jgi:tetratricopeptide (TPR) repeat protein/mono/diheme cytochrome c family protein
MKAFLATGRGMWWLLPTLAVVAVGSRTFTAAPAGGVLSQSARPATQSVTYDRDIQPLVLKNCASCHRPEGSAFSLLTYADAKQHAARMVDATTTRYMPPWKPSPDVGDFVGVRRLTDEQIALIARWVAGGLLEGNGSAPAAAAALPPGGWRLGPPDLVLTMPAYTLRAGGDDMYRHFVLPIPISTKRYVKAWELRPGNLRVVHHATMEIDVTGMSRHLDEEDPQPGYEGLIAHTSMAPDGYFLDWAPGHTPYVAPDGMAFPVEAGSDLVLMLHLRPSGKPEPVQASIGLYFTDVPPTRVPALLRLTRQDMEIPAGASHYAVTTSYRLPVDLDLYTVQPHAHNLAREVEGYATLPDGTIKRLLSITDWDFNWQDVYRYTKPVSLPAGATVTMRWTYDNSPANRRNPNSPPKTVTFGQRTSDEMAELWFQVLPRNQTDRNLFTRGMQTAQLFENLKGYEAMIRADPKNVALHNDVALLYARAGNAAQVEAHFAAAARLAPESAAAQYNLGTALLSVNKPGDARRAFVRATELDSSYANAYRSLGVLAQAEGKIDEASAYYRQALQHAPEDAMAHHNLGMLLQVEHRQDEAIREYREALRLNGNYADALVDLAWALATAPDAGQVQAEEAVTLAQRGAALTNPPTSIVLDVLGVSLAAAGRFDEAIAAAEKAVALATAANNDRELQQIRQRLELYRQRTPFRAPR